jgi:hypothetical protein
VDKVAAAAAAADKVAFVVNDFTVHTGMRLAVKSFVMFQIHPRCTDSM